MSTATATTTDAPGAGAWLARTLAEFRTAGRMDVTFGGHVARDASGLDITATCGARTGALVNLRIASGHGLGGKSLVMGKPLSVADYVAAPGITHPYDNAVRNECLHTVVALPIVVDRQPRMVVYLASRTQVGLGDRWYDAFVPLVRRVERDLAVEDEVRRRLDTLPAESAASTGLTRADLDDIGQELARLAEDIDDTRLRGRVRRLQDRVCRARTPSGSAAVTLARREIDVLEQVDLGHGNRAIAENLGIGESTVKGYLKNAMRKLHANNRVQAIRRARETGLID